MNAFRFIFLCACPRSYDSCVRQLFVFYCHPRCPVCVCVLLMYTHRRLSFSVCDLVGIVCFCTGVLLLFRFRFS